MVGTKYTELKDAILGFHQAMLVTGLCERSSLESQHVLRRIKALERGKFTLAVAGEVKAGKSTFINALLGEEVLRSHCLQCTSAIVEISASENRFVKITFADGREEVVFDDLSTADIDEAAARLAEISCVHPDYASIPTTLIDAYLIRGITDIPIRTLEDQSQLDLQSRQPLIEQYISEFKDLAKIPVQIEYGSPSMGTFRHIRLVDTPGVNALGGIQEKTLEYLGEADAILLVHPLKPIESKSFRTFFEKVSSFVERDRLFLVLCRAAQYSHTEVNDVMREAARLYQEVPSENIVAVDSMLRLIERDLVCRQVSEVMQDQTKAMLLAQFTLHSGTNPDELRPVLMARSGFDKAETMIRDLSSTAHLRQITDAWTSLKALYPIQGDQAGSGGNTPSASMTDTRSRLQSRSDRIEKMLKDYQILGEGAVSFGGRDGVFIVDCVSGKVIWNYETEETVTSMPVVAAGIVLFGCFDGCFYGVDFETSLEKWRLETGDPTHPTPVVADATVFLGSKDQCLYAINLHTGEVRWKFKTNGRVLSTPVVEEGVVYFGSNDGVVYALDAHTGEEKWRFNKQDWRGASPTIVASL